SFDVARQMAEVKGRANASAGEAGVGGVSFANLMSDYEAREGRARGNIDYNYATTQQDLTNQAEASRTKAQSIISSTVKPDPMAPWLAVGG
ncbi:virion core protein, T7 gp14 family, partial [Vibrio parahaemolyticus]